jgi:hypothetical protein
MNNKEKIRGNYTYVASCDRISDEFKGVLRWFVLSQLRTLDSPMNVLAMHSTLA